MNPNTYERMRFNVRVNFGERSVPLHNAVCAKRRELRVKLGHGSTSDSIYRATRLAGATKEHVIQGMSFDDVVAAHIPDGPIDVCKIDVEGAEDEILTAPDSENRSLDRVRNLFVEIHPAERSHAIVKTLEDRGFERLGGGNGTAMCGVHLFRNTRPEPARA
jgi:FkbM family methyltransferase